MNVLYHAVFLHYTLAFRVESFSLRQPGWVLLSVVSWLGGGSELGVLFTRKLNDGRLV